MYSIKCINHLWTILVNKNRVDFIQFFFWRNYENKQHAMRLLPFFSISYLKKSLIRFPVKTTQCVIKCTRLPSNFIWKFPYIEFTTDRLLFLWSDFFDLYNIFWHNWQKYHTKCNKQIIRQKNEKQRSRMCCLYIR